MRCACPCCGFTAEPEAFFVLPEERAFWARLASLPPALHTPLRRYLGLHRPRGRILVPARALKLLEELAAPIAAASLRRKGRDWPAPLETWIEALDQVLARDEQGALKRPLNGHGYLFEVVVGLADRHEGHTEAAREQARQHPGPERTARATAAPTPVRQVLDRARADAGLALLKQGLARCQGEDDEADTR
jgi:hypothetical protein